MTDEQFFQLLDELHVHRVTKPAGGKITLYVADEDPPTEITVSDMKSRSHDAIRELEERRRDTRENRFADPLTKQIDLGGTTTSAVQYLKRDDQLTAEEQETKRRLLGEIEGSIAYHRMIIAAMNHLQVNFAELESRLAGPRGHSNQPAGHPQADGGRVPWTKGIKSAALHCIRESKKQENAGKTELEICREFLEEYVILEDEEYCAEHLYRNIQQIKLLDDID